MEQIASAGVAMRKKPVGTVQVLDKFPSGSP